MRRAAWMAAGVALGAAVAGGAVVGVRSGGAGAAAATPAPVPVATVEVERRTLHAEEQLDGSLGYAQASSLINLLSGTVTRAPEAGDVLHAGDRVLEVEGRVRSGLLYGDRPAWRRLARGVPDGFDVEQLERGLQVLGYTSRSFRPNTHFDSATETAVKRWQRDLGVTRDGVLELGELVFSAGPVRLTSVELSTGERAAPGALIAHTTSIDHVVSGALPADEQEKTRVGDAVTVEMPDGSVAPGTVSDVGRVATADDSGDLVVDLEVTLADPSGGGSLDGAPVTIDIPRDTRADVLAVPVDALLALREGGYAVEVVDASGSHHLVGIQLGMFDDGYVQVTGNIAEHDLVVVPS
jgi:Putative peptidoglycan binding domain